jgi:hypothetical protein
MNMTPPRDTTVQEKLPSWKDRIVKNGGAETHMAS